MKGNLIILRTLLSYNPIVNIIGFVLYLLVASVLVFSFTNDQPKQIHGTVFFILVISASMIFVFNFAEKLGQLSTASYNHLLPNFNKRLVLNIFLIHLILTGIPSTIGYVSGLASFKLFLATNVLALSVLIVNIFSIIAGSIWFAISILSLSSEASKLKKIDGYQAYEYLPLSQETLIGALFALSIGVLVLIAKRTKKARRSVKKSAIEEISIRYKKMELMNIIDRYWIVFKYKLYNVLGLLSNRIEVVLLSGQYQLISIFRIIVAVLVIINLFDQSTMSFLLGIEDGIDKNNGSFLDPDNAAFLGSSIVLLALLGSFDHSILTRFRFAQRYLWLKEPISGFTAFKRVYSRTLIRKILVEVIVTGLIWLTLISSEHEFMLKTMFLLLSFLSFKLFSILVGFWSLNRSNMKLVYFLAAAFYTVYFAVWFYLAFVISTTDLIVLSVSTLIFVALLTKVYQRFMREQIIN